MALPEQIYLAVDSIYINNPTKQFFKILLYKTQWDTVDYQPDCRKRVRVTFTTF